MKTSTYTSDTGETKSPKTLWSYIKGLRQENVGIGDLKNKNNIPVSDPVQKATLLHQQFDSVFSDPKPTIIPNLDPKDRQPDLEKITISRNGILKLLLNINANKANGPDDVPGKFLKLYAHDLADVYQILFQT